MKKCHCVSLLLLFALPSLALAQNPHEAGLFGDPAGTITSTTVPGFGQFNLYLVAFDLDGLVFGYEGEVVSAVGFFPDPDGVTILGTTLTGPSPLNVGNDTNFIVGTGGCVDGLGAFTVLSYTLGYFASSTAPDDMMFCLQPSTPSSFTPTAPGYLRCDGELVPFGAVESGNAFYPDGCFVANPLNDPPVGTSSQSWGSVKAGF